MQTTPVTANAVQLKRLGFVNCYLVHESDGYTLIDTGIQGSAPGILAAARALGSPIRRILLTHAHVDHVGSVDALANSLPGVVVATSARTVPLLRRPPDLSLRPGDPGGKIQGQCPGIATRVTHTIEHGDLFGSFRVIATPGHIPGQVSFLDERDGTLYAGDALIAIGQLGVAGFRPWWFPLRIAQSLPTALASARHLLDYPIQRFACGHGPVREGGRPTLEAAIARAETYPAAKQKV
jgi:glyoxylase-like metal-dependent hydrolase (beta-lactamase superfamily II)